MMERGLQVFGFAPTVVSKTLALKDTIRHVSVVTNLVDRLKVVGVSRSVDWFNMPSKSLAWVKSPIGQHGFKSHRDIRLVETLSCQPHEEVES